MRIPPEGKPFVPPNPICPSKQEGRIPDVGAVLFRLFLDPSPSGTDPTGIMGLFNTVSELGEQKDFVQTAWWEVSPDSPVVQRLYELLPSHSDREMPQLLDVDNEQSPFVQDVRTAFCERILDCQGVVNGECWALGVAAVQEVIETTLRDHEAPSK